MSSNTSLEGLGEAFEVGETVGVEGPFALQPETDKTATNATAVNFTLGLRD